MVPRVEGSNPFLHPKRSLKSGLFLLVCRTRLKSLFNGAKFDIFLRFNNIFFTLVPLLRGGANYLRKSFVEGIIVATFDAQIIKDNIKL